MRQEGVLLALVEAVHLVDEDDGAAPGRAGCVLQRRALRDLGLLHRLPDVLHATEHRADGDELGVERTGHQAGDGGLAGAGRSPQDAAVRLTRLEGDAQRHALTEQLLLADHLAQRLRAQALGQRRMGGWR